MTQAPARALRFRIAIIGLRPTWSISCVIPLRARLVLLKSSARLLRALLGRCGISRTSLLMCRLRLRTSNRHPRTRYLRYPCRMSLLFQVGSVELLGENGAALDICSQSWDLVISLCNI